MLMLFVMPTLQLITSSPIVATGRKYPVPAASIVVIRGIHFAIRMNSIGEVTWTLVGITDTENKDTRTVPMSGWLVVILLLHRF